MSEAPVNRDIIQLILSGQDGKAAVRIQHQQMLSLMQIAESLRKLETALLNPPRIVSALGASPHGELKPGGFVYTDSTPTGGVTAVPDTGNSPLAQAQLSVGDAEALQMSRGASHRSSEADE
jgi:hypothetical protein